MDSTIASSVERITVTEKLALAWVSENITNFLDKTSFSPVAGSVEKVAQVPTIKLPPPDADNATLMETAKLIDEVRPRLSLLAWVSVEALQTVGFFAVTGHGIPREVVSSASGSARAFFDLPASEKATVAMPYQGYPYGYAAVGSEALSKSTGTVTPPDLKETFSVGPPQRPQHLLRSEQAVPESVEAFVYAESQWPEEPPQLRSHLETYYHAMGDLAAYIMKLFALALELPSDHFEDKIDAHISALRVVNYPEVDPSLARPELGQLRAGAHSDYGSLTILLGEDRPGIHLTNPVLQLTS
eukprot:gene14359-16983_t